MLYFNCTFFQVFKPATPFAQKGWFLLSLTNLCSIMSLFNRENSLLSNKVIHLIAQVRKEIEKICKLNKSIEDMPWEEKISSLPSDAWILEQMMQQIENYLKRKTINRSRGNIDF
tara:strand:+ start:6914 stop:7258 length:345 start_codon:yes stop_codon:yes gene_type:complete